jgi:hypothetical protein
MARPDGRVSSVEGISRDLVTIIHRRSESPDVVVGTVNRMTVFRGSGRPSAISEEDCRRSVAEALVVDLPTTNGDNLIGRISELIDEEKWDCREGVIDGESSSGEEAVFEDTWAAWFLKPSIFVYLMAPVAMGAEGTELRRLGGDEMALPTGWAYAR